MVPVMVSCLLTGMFPDIVRFPPEMKVAVRLAVAVKWPEVADQRAAAFVVLTFFTYTPDRAAVIGLPVPSTSATLLLLAANRRTGKGLDLVVGGPRRLCRSSSQPEAVVQVVGVRHVHRGAVGGSEDPASRSCR